MFKKSLAVGSLVALMMPVQYVSAVPINNIENTENIELKEKEFSLFGLYNKTYYKSVLQSLDSMRANAIISMECLNKLENSLNAQKTEDNSDADDKLQNNVSESFQDFLQQQMVLDNEIIKFLDLCGFKAETEEDIKSDNLDQVSEESSVHVADESSEIVE